MPIPQQAESLPKSPFKILLVDDEPGIRKILRLFLELEQSRLYAVRVNADLAYGFVPETSLAGDYIEGRCL